MIGAGHVVAEGGGAVAADEDTAGGRDLVCQQCRILLHQLEVLWGEGIGKIDRIIEVGYSDER